MAYKVWGGRFSEELDELVHEFNASISFDKRLYRQDIEGSKAHVKMLSKQGIVPEKEAHLILKALDSIKKAIEDGELLPSQEYEDIHSFVEAQLVQRIGEAGKKLHTARSRNDQVALDLRLFLRDEIKEILGLLRSLRRAIVQKAEEYIDVPMPGYTHLQRAQPVLVSHHLMAYYFMFERDHQRFWDCLKRTQFSPLGSGAIAGSSLPIDRNHVAESLGLNAPTQNSMDGVSDRDFALEFLGCSCILMMHLSRLSEELVLWMTKEFSFIELRDAFCTGSSLMPQKKNPDVPELIRGKTGRVYGNLMALLTTMKGLPLTYNKDMQEDKEAVFDTCDTISQCLRLSELIIKDLRFNKERLEEAIQKGNLTATDLVEYLVLKGLSFRQAHELVGRMVSYASQEGKELSQLEIEELKAFCPHIEADVYNWLDPKESVNRKSSFGSTSLKSVLQQIRYAKEELEKC